MPHYKTVTEVLLGNGLPAPEHPLLAVFGCNNNCSAGEREFTSDLYMISFKKLKAGIIRYGRTQYDHSNGSMLFARPSQIIQMRDLQFEEDGFMILFHEDYLQGHELQKTIPKYGFFDYETNEALHLSPREESIIKELHGKIEMEYQNNPDEYSREIILSHISSILTYSQRFYKRQFINRTPMSGHTITKFSEALQEYIQNGSLQSQGLPSVNYLAERLYLSPRYLSDLLKQETGKTAMDLIHTALISEAKSLLRDDTQNIASVAYQLGFENTSYFTRLFKKQTGLRPLEFKKSGLN